MDEQDAGPALFDKILDNDVIHLRQLFPAMIKFLECMRSSSRLPAPVWKAFEKLLQQTVTQGSRLH